jgi:hypothetical protein
MPGGLSLTWSEAIFSDAPTVLDILRLPEACYALPASHPHPRLIHDSQLSQTSGQAECGEH